MLKIFCKLDFFFSLGVVNQNTVAIAISVCLSLIITVNGLTIVWVEEIISKYLGILYL